MTATERTYRKIRKLRLFVACIFSICILEMDAQQIFPVNVEGMLMGPHSLVLSDYGFDRSEDILFIVTLQDPEEEFRLVKFNLTVSNDGQDILMTDPNYNPPPIMLEKDMPMMLNGADLAGYFEAANLISFGGFPAGDLLPEGFNGICLEVIDVERNVPISDQFCTFGFFQLSDPPILNTPICGAIIPADETQNLVFNWIPQHASAVNPPMGIEYEFTLVELLPGQSPYDVFVFSLPLYQTTVLSPTIFYLEDAPLLEPGKLYAWRVQAIDVMGFDLFNNNGYSEICTFSLLDDETEEEDNNANNCESGQCIWTGELSTVPQGNQISIGDMVDIGQFSMELTEVQSLDGQYYQGEGIIYISFLATKLKVFFSDLEINEDMRVFSGTVYNQPTENPELIPPLFDIYNNEPIDADMENISENFSDDVALALEQFYQNEGLTPPHLVSLLSGVPESETVPITVPVGLDNSGDLEGDDIVISITGFKFEATKASLNAVMASKIDELNDWLKFGIKDFCFHNEGLAQGGDSKLELLNDLDIEYLDVEINLDAQNTGDKGTYLEWDCQGFENFYLTGNISFNYNTFQNLSLGPILVQAPLNLATPTLEGIDSTVVSAAAVPYTMTVVDTMPWYDSYKEKRMPLAQNFDHLTDYNDRLLELMGEDHLMRDMYEGSHYQMQGFLLLNESSQKFNNKESMENARKAIPMFEKAIELQGVNALDYVMLSECYLRLNELDEAYRYARLAVQYSPTWDMAYTQVANVYMRSGQTSLAKKWINESLQLQSASYANYNALGFIAFTEAFRSSLHPDESWKIKSYTFDQSVKYDQSGFDSMKELYEQSLNVEPNAKAYYQMGVANAMAGNFAEAESLYLKALGEDATYLGVYKGLFFVYGRQNETDKLNSLLEQMESLSWNTEEPEYNKILSIAKLLSGNQEASTKHLDTALAIDNTDSDLLYEISRIYAIKGNENKALEYFEKAARIEKLTENELQENPDYANLRDLPLTKDLIKKN